MKEGWRQYLSLQTHKGRHKERKIIVEGVRLVREAFLSDWSIEKSFITENFSNSSQWPEFKEYFKQKKINFSIIQSKNFRELADTENPQGIIVIVKHPSTVPENQLYKLDFILILQSIRDPGNLGTLIRTADWFNTKAIILSHDCVDFFNSKVLRSSMGSIFHLPVLESNDLKKTIKKLKQNNFQIVATSLNAANVLEDINFIKPVVLILGGEANGVSADIVALANIDTRIWKYGKAESLNVAIAGAILMNHIANVINKS